MKKVFLFDLDDTLMQNEYTYSLAAIKFFEWLLMVFHKRLPFVGDIARRLQEISFSMLKETNPRTGKPYGFSMDRFPDSLVECYRELCQNGWGEYDSMAAEGARKIGLMAFDEELYRQTGFVPGAQIVLDFLKQKEDQLILLTKGDPEVQERKIIALELSQWFDRSVIVSQKDEKLFRGFKKGLGGDGRNIFSVGNSFSSDIEPALKAGIGAVFIPCFTWKAESVEKGRLTVEEEGRLHEIKEIRQLIDIYDKL